MTKLVGLAGPAGCGKDTVGEMLEMLYGWRHFAFSDGLYDEVSVAFRVPIYDMKNRETKEKPVPNLALSCCTEWLAVLFIYPVALEKDSLRAPSKVPLLRRFYPSVNMVLKRPRSPREILQWWGTDYRRSQNPRYWLNRAQESLESAVALKFPGTIVTDVRFPDEAEWVRDNGGVVVHVHRPGYEPANNHIAERPLEQLPTDLSLLNQGSLADLSAATTRLVFELDGAGRANAGV